jgi:hypothetical protein
MTLFIELNISIYLYTLLCLTDFMGKLEIRELLALALVSYIGLTILVNLILLGKRAVV